MSSCTSSSDRPQRAIKHLGCFGATALVVAATLFGASEMLVRSKVSTQDEFINHANLFHTSPHANVAFGDSHVARGFVPPANMVNLAYPSEGIEHIDWKVRTYFARRKPGRIILQADPHLLAPYRVTNRLGNYPAKIKAAFNGQEWRPLTAEPRYRANLVNYWSSYIKQGGQLVSRIKVLENGALLSPGDLSSEDARLRAFNARRRITVHSIRAHPAVDRLMETYSGILEFLQARGADVCLVTFPVSPDYLNASETSQSNAAQRERRRVMRFFKAEAHKRGMQHADLRTLTSDRSEFRDVDHLNGAAAVRYSKAMMDACFTT